jgi:uncharacterized protein YyaL (SSP411 family)
MLTIEKVNATKDKKFENNLIHETSPYLLQHAHNPVNWHSWGDEAFEKARKENKPILLSIGYSTCHWCHVMEHESFEDLEIAKMMNDNYIPIKVDREQRPDVDSIYMSVVQSMTGHGGWPMTVWLTPDKEPFYGGTYFPPRDGHRPGHPGFLELLERLSSLYKQHNGEITMRAKEITQQIQSHLQFNQGGDLPTTKTFDRGFEEFARMYDPRYGGFGFAPKFPRPVSLQFLLHYGYRNNNAKATSMATDTLKAMLFGGIYDQLGGGFHRYSVDTYWLVSHFEKMLYDQSQIVLSMLDAYQITKDGEFKRGVDETLSYIMREMTSPEGGFYSATDADSEGEEGKFFVWPFAELKKTLDQMRDEGRAKYINEFLEYYALTQDGNFEGNNILSVRVSVEAFAKTKNMDVATLVSDFDQIKSQLLAERAKRVPPLTDDKIIASWNGLMIAAFARAGMVLSEPKYLEAAKGAAHCVLKMLVHENKLHRSFRSGKFSSEGFLDDYACMIYGLLELFETTGEVHWFDHAKTFQDQMIQQFWDHTAGGFFASSDPSLFAKEKPFYDGAEPSGNSIAAWNLLRFSSITKDESYRDYAAKIFKAFANVIETNPTYLPQMLVSLDYYHSKSKEIVLVEGTDYQKYEQLLDTVRSTYLPNRILVQAKASSAKSLERWPSIGEKLGVKSTTAYVCEGFVCQAPATDAETFQNQLKPDTIS